MIEIDSVWEQIEDTLTAENRNGIIKRHIMSEWESKLFLGVELETRRRLFILEAPYKILRDLGSLPQTNGVEASIRYMGDEDEHNLSLIIITKKIHYHDLFVPLIKDILERLDAQDTEKSVEIVISRLLRWQKFLEKFHFEGLGEEAQRGLFGELYFLNRLLEAEKNILTVIKAWRGPERTVHDFIFHGCATEVKTSISKQHQKVYVSSERQLDDSQSGVLFLYHLSLDNQSGLGNSLNQIIQVIRQKLSNTPLEKESFEDKLFESGYLDIHAERYNSTVYSVRENNIFKVVEGFPRIIESELAVGIGDVKYSVMISECKHFRVQETDMLQLIGDASSYG
jgi:hypothetical protein